MVMGMSTGTDVQKYLWYLYFGCCLVEHSGDNSKGSPALKQKILICIVCLWSPFSQTFSISPISECPRYQQPCSVQNGGCGRKRLEGACLERRAVRTVSQQQICFYFGQMDAQSPSSSSRNTDPLSLSQEGFEIPALENITFPIITTVKCRYILSG